MPVWKKNARAVMLWNMTDSQSSGQVDDSLHFMHYGAPEMKRSASRVKWDMACFAAMYQITEHILLGQSVVYSRMAATHSSSSNSHGASASTSKGSFELPGGQPGRRVINIKKWQL